MNFAPIEDEKSAIPKTRVIFRSDAAAICETFSRPRASSIDGSSSSRFFKEYSSSSEVNNFSTKWISAGEDTLRDNNGIEFVATKWNYLNNIPVSKSLTGSVNPYREEFVTPIERV